MTYGSHAHFTIDNHIVYMWARSPTPRNDFGNDNTKVVQYFNQLGSKYRIYIPRRSIYRVCHGCV